MRLWHTHLIPYLPKQQLLGQWRELNSIYKLQNKHILINFVYEYDKTSLWNYSSLVIKEMFKRNYKINMINHKSYFGNFDYQLCPNDCLFPSKMNNRYLKQCLYNLQEKYDCGGISKEEWRVIENVFHKYL